MNHRSARLLLFLVLCWESSFSFAPLSRCCTRRFGSVTHSTVRPLVKSDETSQPVSGQISSVQGSTDCNDDILLQLTACAKVTAHDSTAVGRAERLWMSLDSPPTDVTLFNAFMETYAYAKLPDSVQRVQSLLQSMRDNKVQPNDESLALVMEAYTQTKDWEGFDAFWESAVAQSEEVQLSSILFNKRLRALGIQGKASEAEEILRQHLNADGVSSPTGSSPLVNAKSWVHVLRAHANQMRHAATEEKEEIFSHVQSLMREMGSYDCVPTTDAYNAVLMAMVRVENLPDKAAKAESILFGLLDKCREDPSREGISPNADTFFYVYQACRGQHFPKVDTLWQLQVGLWRQATDAEARRRLVPSVRNLNAAIAVLGRSRLPNKAHKARQLMQQLDAIREECKGLTTPEEAEQPENTVLLPPMESDVGTYKNLLRCCAFISHANSTPRDRKEALEIALSARHTLLVDWKVGGADATLIYRLLLQSTGHLVDRPMRRDDMATELFQECCSRGLVDDSVVTAFERAASETVVLKMLGGFAEDLIKLPDEWTANTET